MMNKHIMANHVTLCTSIESSTACSTFSAKYRLKTNRSSSIAATRS
eukprot:CAMPEP_0115707674 /NCGR_PEP_ID=MMETSP0272-20121206/71486_1 /TAXON_ID=71861 /ORGANISM="Scrippsiella trochoidea, Strain CCMP3099" /LENGTH=45 /DNA_ID= /DNA_START= /DNA_END= /DNA_ORIENTATION=